MTHLSKGRWADVLAIVGPIHRATAANVGPRTLIPWLSVAVSVAMIPSEIILTKSATDMQPKG